MAGILAFTISLNKILITLFVIGNDTTWPIKLWAKIRVGFSKQVNASITLILIFDYFISFADSNNYFKIRKKDAELNDK